MIHHCEGLAFGGKAGDDRLAVHPRFDDLQRNLPLHRPFLLGEENQPHSTLADFFDQFVVADAPVNRSAAGEGTIGEKLPAFIQRGQKRFHFCAQG